MSIFHVKCDGWLETAIQCAYFIMTSDHKINYLFKTSFTIFLLTNAWKSRKFFSFSRCINLKCLTKDHCIILIDNSLLRYLKKREREKKKICQILTYQKLKLKLRRRKWTTTYHKKLLLMMKEKRSNKFFNRRRDYTRRR